MDSNIKDKVLEQNKEKKRFLSVKTSKKIDRLFIPIMGSIAIICLTLISLIRLSQHDQEVPQHVKEFYLQQHAIKTSNLLDQNTDQQETVD